MRNITNYSTFLDGTSLLDGMLYVYEHGTTTQASVYDNAGVALEQPIYITNGKPSHQVFVNDESVDCKVYAGTTLKDSWEDIFVKETISFDGLPTVDKIADLRTASASVGDSVVLLGYNAKNDKPALVYTLKFNALLEDDGGLTIAGAVSGTYWVAKTEGTVDVRHYGVFPNGSTPLPNIPNIRWYFPYLGASAYEYNISGNSIKNATFDNGVHITSNADQQAYIYDSDVDGIKVKGYTKVVGNTIRTSVLGDTQVQFQARETLIIDNNLYPVSASNCNIQVYANFNKNITAVDCNIYGKGGIISSATQTLTRCTINNRCLTYQENGTYTACTSTASDWSSIDSFAAFMLANGHKTIDCNGGTLSQLPQTGEDCTIINASLSNLEVINPGATVSFKDCSGTLVSTSQVAKIRFDNCYIDCSTESFVCPHIEAYKTKFLCNLTFTSDSIIKDCETGYLYIKVDDEDEVANITIEGNNLTNNDITFSAKKWNGNDASTGSVYLNNVYICHNHNISGSSNKPATIIDNTIFQEHLGIYKVFDNDTYQESILPHSGSIRKYVALSQITYNNSTHMMYANDVFSVKALTFNFGENYNKNKYLGYDTNMNAYTWIKAQIRWQNSSSQNRKTSDSARKIFQLPSNFWNSQTQESNIGMNWTTLRNSGAGLPYDDSSWTVDEQCHNFLVIGAWNQFADEDYDVYSPS